MKLNSGCSRFRRRGWVVPLAAILMVFLVAMVAFAVDIAYIVKVRKELQNAADATALAGASQVLHRSLVEGSPNTALAKDAVRLEAQAFARRNVAGGVSLNLGLNLNDDPDGDIVAGYLENPADLTEPLDFEQFPNSVRVRLRRDTVQNGSLALFFARVLGINTQDLRATATATQKGDIRGFRIQTPGRRNPKLLPFALDAVVWDNAPGRPWYDPSRPPGVVQGNGQDLFTRNDETGAVTSGADGIHECKLYPLSNGSDDTLPPGNFGTVDIGSSGNSAADVARQILYGPNEADLAHYPNGEFKLNEANSPPSIVLDGDTGVSAGFKDELEAIIGQARVIPLYIAPVVGNGDNAQFTIVAFAGITVTEVVLKGSLRNKHLTIQPCFVTDESAVGGTVTWTSTFVYRPVSLTR
jgi:hypothetical protein